MGLVFDRDGAAQAFLALGSNLGDRMEHLCAARSLLETHRELVVDRVGGLYETFPVGGPPGQGHYLNSAVGIRTHLQPRDLLHTCLEIERHLGRRRDVRNGPRVIDLDLLLYDDHVCESDALTLPHPRLHLRRFVLEPLHDIAPETVHPVLRRTVGQLLVDVRLGDGGEQLCTQVRDRRWCSEIPIPCIEADAV